MNCNGQHCDFAVLVLDKSGSCNLPSTFPLLLFCWCPDVWHKGEPKPCSSWLQSLLFQFFAQSFYRRTPIRMVLEDPVLQFKLQSMPQSTMSIYFGEQLLNFELHLCGRQVSFWIWFFLQFGYLFLMYKVIIMWMMINSFCYLRIHLYHHPYQAWCGLQQRSLSISFTTSSQLLKGIWFCINREAN